MLGFVASKAMLMVVIAAVGSGGYFYVQSLRSQLQAAVEAQQKLEDARSITYFVRRRGLYATNFLSNALTNEQIDVLINTISEVLGKQVSLSTEK